MSRAEREFERINATIPVMLENGAEAETRNLSPQGIFFVTDQTLEVGKSMRFTVEFASAPAVTFYLDCVAEIVRVENADGKTGVGAKILESRLERRPPPGDTGPRKGEIQERASCA